MYHCVQILYDLHLQILFVPAFRAVRVIYVDQASTISHMQLFIWMICVGMERYAVEQLHDFFRFSTLQKSFIFTDPGSINALICFILII